MVFPLINLSIDARNLTIIVGKYMNEFRSWTLKVNLAPLKYNYMFLGNGLYYPRNSILQSVLR